MIKGYYFLKLLKPLFSILLIGFFGLLGNSFVNAGKVQLVGFDGYPSIYDSNYQLTFLKGGGLLSSFLGQGKGVLALTDKAFFWWSTNGQPYYYDNTYQGFFGQYWLCDELTGYDSFPSNCTSYSITGDFKNIFKGFFTSVKIEDLVYYNYEGADIGSSYYDNTIEVCRSSSEFGRSLCFRQHECYNGRGCSASNYGSLINSQNLSNLTYSLIANSWIGKAPGQNGYDGEYVGNTEGSNQGFIDSSYTGDYTYIECTNGSIMNYVENMGISSYLCRGGLDNWDLFVLTGIYNPIPGSGKWVDDIFGYTRESSQGAKDWFNYWNTTYINQYVSNQNIWFSKPAVLRSYFKIYNDYGGNNFDFDTVYEYCLMRKFYVSDNQFATQKYNGQYFKKTCTFINNGGWDGQDSSNTGEDIVGLNWNGVGSLSGTKTYNDPGVFITDMFTKIKSYISSDKSDVGLGFLPTYIISFMLFLILFRFLSH